MRAGERTSIKVFGFGLLAGPKACTVLRLKKGKASYLQQTLFAGVWKHKRVWFCE
jgi:hypothetical protein